MVQSVSRLVQVTRNQGQPIQQFLTAPSWIDVVSLTGGAAKDYEVPTGAAFLRLTPTVLPTYGNFNGAAAAPSTDVTDGSASFPVISQTTLVAPNVDATAGLDLSLICASNCLVTIEVWD